MNDQNPTPVSAPAPAMSTPRSNSRMRLVIGLFVAFVIVAGGVLWLLNSVYTKRADNPLIRAVAPVLPAAHVDSKTISYQQFLETRDTLRVYLASDAAKDAQLAQELTPELEKNGFERMIREILVEDLAKERNVQVSDEDIRGAFAELTASTSSSIPNVADYLDKTFKWTEEDFRAHVIRPSLLETRLAQSFANVTGTEVTQEQMDAGYAQLEAEVQKRQASPEVKIYLKF